MNKKIEVQKETKITKNDPVKKEKVEKVSSFKKKKKVKRNIVSGIAYVYSTFNNTIISIADESGNVIAWSSAGTKGFKGSENLPHMQLKLLQTMLVEKLLNKV